jgi:tRNA(Ile)-lysidine synthase TilS/MesJ
VQVVLRGALANADALLEDARKDQPSIAQALKMTNTDTTVGSDDDFIEKLRWFVYPKECATWLSEGRIVPPETESENILGALRPVQYSCESLEGSVNDIAMLPPVTSVSCEPGMGQTAGLETRKRKLSHTTCDFSEPNADRQTEVGRDLPGDNIQSHEQPVSLQFRDGEHAGEAPFDEIVVGYDDGELSARCEIYNPKIDAWVAIETYVQGSSEEGPTLMQSDQPSSVTESDEQKSYPAELSSSQTPQPPIVPAILTTRDVANQRKKPQRDSASWGSTANVSMDIKTAHSVAVPGTDAAATSVEAPILTGGAASVSNGTSTKKKRGRGIKPPPKLLRYITQAMIQWNMVEEGDRLLLGLSGGKDSLSLLHCLLEFQRKLPINFEIEVCTIDPMTPSFDPSPLIPYVESLGLKYHYIRDDIVARANTSGKDGNVVSSLCAFCARMKRGNLYACARKNNCNKLVLAQHLDDCAESFLMSAMHNGFLRTMKANYQINAGDLSVIRPMVYCRESLMTAFAKSANLPVINENCPACFEEPKERARIKKLLAREETLYPNLHDNIRRSLIPLMHDDATPILRCYLEEAVSKSRRNGVPKNGGKARQGKRGADTSVLEKDQGDQKPAVTAKSATVPLDNATHDSKRIKTVLAEASDEDLMKELARRKAEKFRLSGAMKRLKDDKECDPTGQVCSLNGGDGSIPCYELME